MSGFLYFLPQTTGSVNLDDMRRSPIGYAFGGSHAVSCCGLASGPDGKTGLVVADPSRVSDRRLRYDKSRQNWLAMPWLMPNTSPGRIAGAEPVPWVGCWEDEKPGPADLVRRDLIDGHWVKMGDGKAWLIPVARGVADDAGELRYTIELPQRIGLDDSGKWRSGEVVERYAELWTWACRWWDMVSGAVRADAEAGMASDGLVLDFDGCTDAALCALATNYVVGRAEVALLELLTDQNVQTVLEALIDWPTLSVWLEKKTETEAGSDTVSGS